MASRLVMNEPCRKASIELHRSTVLAFAAPPSLPSAPRSSFVRWLIVPTYRVTNSVGHEPSLRRPVRRHEEDLYPVRHRRHLQGPGRHALARGDRIRHLLLGVRKAHATRGAAERHPARPGQPRERGALRCRRWIRGKFKFIHFVALPVPMLLSCSLDVPFPFRTFIIIDD